MGRFSVFLIEKRTFWRDAVWVRCTFNCANIGSWVANVIMIENWKITEWLMIERASGQGQQPRPSLRRARTAPGDISKRISIPQGKHLTLSGKGMRDLIQHVDSQEPQ